MPDRPSLNKLDLSKLGGLSGTVLSNKHSVLMHPRLNRNIRTRGSMGAAHRRICAVLHFLGRRRHTKVRVDALHFQPHAGTQPEDIAAFAGLNTLKMPKC